MNIHKSKKDILNGNITQQLLLFTFPYCVGYLVQQIYAFADGIILGRIVGTSALASVGGSATAIINVMLNFISGLSNGVLVIVAQHYGRGNKNGVKQAVKTGMFISFVLGAVLTLFGILSATPFLKIMNTPAETVSDSLTYMYFYYASFIPYLIYMTGTSILRATGDTKRPLIFIGVQAVTKIGFDLIFAGTFKLGIFGTSLATFVSNSICGVLILVLFALTPDSYGFNIKEFGYDLQNLKESLKIGIPSGIQTSVFSLSVLMLQAKVNAFGTNAAAALTAYNNVDNIFWAQSNGLGLAVITLVGQNYGSKKYERVNSIVKKALLIDLIICIYMGLINGYLGKYELKLFTSDQEVISIGEQMLKTVSFNYWTYTLVEVLSCFGKGIGDMFNNMIISMIGICGVRFVYLILFPLNTPSEVLFVYPLSWFVTGFLYLIYCLLSKKYKQIRTCEGK